MKTIEQKIRLCSMCKKREFDPKCGLICSLTKEKPGLEDGCEDYTLDEKGIDRANEIDNDIKKEKVISGWLAFFLWYTMGTSILVLLKDLIGIPLEGLGWWLSAIFMAIYGLVISIGVLT